MVATTPPGPAVAGSVLSAPARPSGRDPASTVRHVPVSRAEGCALPADAVDVTVVVPTTGRPEGLRRLLVALVGQEDPGASWEVVVVDNHPTPTVEDVVHAGAHELAVRVVHEPVPGASAARNRGIDAARGTWTALLDDDVVPSPDWLATLARACTAHVDGCGGRVVLDPTVSLPGWMDASLAGFVTALDLGPTPRVLGDDEYLLTANAAFRTDLLQQLRFDPALGPRPGAHLTNDDLDLVRRARAAGARLVWVPGAVVVHDAPADRLHVRWLATRAYQQGRSDRRLDAASADAARLGGLRAGGWYLRDRTRHWWGATDRRATFAAHLLAEVMRTLGWWRESLAAVRGRPAVR